MWPMIAAAAGGAILGGVAGYQKDVVTQNSSSGVNLKPISGLEASANSGMGIDYNLLRQLVGAGPGQSDVSSSLGASRDLAAMLKAYSLEGGADPTSGDISRAGSLADMLFKSQRVQMEQGFGDQLTQANRQAALMGRGVNDPILKAKLATEQTRQAAVLNAQQGGWATQYAMQQPLQRLGFATDRANVLGGLASQAMANRQALLSMGSNIQANERNWRLSTSDKWSNGEQASGGGLKGAITGGLAGMSTGMSAMGGMGGFGGGAMGAGGGAPSPFSGYNYGQQPSQFFGVSSGSSLMNQYGR